MQEHTTRRRLLRWAATTPGVALGVGGKSRAQRRSSGRAFAPAENGFGFRNWSTRNQYFDPPPDPPRATIRERVRTEWHQQVDSALNLEMDGLPNRLIDAMTTQLRTAVVQRAGTNGHCYGMVLAAQQYFEDPGEIPVNRRTASEIEDPTVPVEEPIAPVYEDIVQLQAAQFLRFRPWLGRRSLLHPEWIDTRSVISDVQAVVERFGTAALVLFDGSLYMHQVLAHGFDDRGDTAVISIYDPNRSAAAYGGNASELRFESNGETLSMTPYGRYTGVLFNRYDRIEGATNRRNANPGDHLFVDDSTVRASLFPLALIQVDSDGVTLAVDAPNGAELGRIRSSNMDRTRGDYARVRALYGAAPGSYRIHVFGRDETDYELSVVAAGPDEVIVDTKRSGTIETGAVHGYVLEIPESGRGSIDRMQSSASRLALAGGAGVLGGITVGTLGYRALRQRSTRERIEQRPR